MLPEAFELIVIKNEVFGVEVYAPAAMCDFSPRYAVDPEAVVEVTLVNVVVGGVV